MSNTITIKEFKMWLMGVEEMQSPDWTPDHNQWKVIRAKINLIDVAEAPVPSHPVMQPYVPSPNDVGPVTWGSPSTSPAPFNPPAPFVPASTWPGGSAPEHPGFATGPTNLTGGAAPDGPYKSDFAD